MSSIKELTKRFEELDREDNCALTLIYDEITSKIRFLFPEFIVEDIDVSEGKLYVVGTLVLE